MQRSRRPEPAVRSHQLGPPRPHYAGDALRFQPGRVIEIADWFRLLHAAGHAQGVAVAQEWPAPLRHQFIRRQCVHQQVGARRKATCLTAGVRYYPAPKAVPAARRFRRVGDLHSGDDVRPREHGGQRGFDGRFSPPNPENHRRRQQHRPCWQSEQPESERKTRRRQRQQKQWPRRRLRPLKPNPNPDAGNEGGQDQIGYQSHI